MKSNEAKREHKRFARRYWIDSQFQTPFLLFYLGPFLALFACTQVFTSAPEIVWCAVGILIIAVPLGILFSHRIAGPVYRINQQMKSDANGHRMKLIKFREKDFFPEMAGSYNVLSMAINKARENKD